MIYEKKLGNGLWSTKAPQIEANASLYTEETMKDIKFEIKQKIGTVALRDNGIKIELNLVSWNDAPAKYEIRSWGRTAGGERLPYRGMTFAVDEIKQLRSLLDSLKL